MRLTAQVHFYRRKTFLVFPTNRCDHFSFIVVTQTVAGMNLNCQTYAEDFKRIFIVNHCLSTLDSNPELDGALMAIFRLCLKSQIAVRAFVVIKPTHTPSSASDVNFELFDYLWVLDFTHDSGDSHQSKHSKTVKVKPCKPLKKKPQVLCLCS